MFLVEIIYKNRIMKVLNLIWGFTLGAGIDKCFLTYARLNEIDEMLEIRDA